MRPALLGPRIDSDRGGIAEVVELEVVRPHAYERVVAPHLGGSQVLGCPPAQRGVLEGDRGGGHQVAQGADALKQGGRQQKQAEDDRGTRGGGEHTYANPTQQADRERPDRERGQRRA